MLPHGVSPRRRKTLKQAWNVATVREGWVMECCCSPKRYFTHPRCWIKSSRAQWQQASWMPLVSEAKRWPPVAHRGKQNILSILSQTRLAGIEWIGAIFKHAICWSKRNTGAALYLCKYWVYLQVANTGASVVSCWICRACATHTKHFQSPKRDRKVGGKLAVTKASSPIEHLKTEQRTMRCSMNLKLEENYS